MKTTVPLLLCLFCFLGCSSDRWVRDTLTEKDDYSVYLEHRIENEREVPFDFAHPAELTPHELGSILQGLTYREPALFGEDDLIPVFQENEVKALTGPLLKALKKARSAERVRLISYNYGGGLLFDKRRKTEGVLFFEKPDALNIAFAYVNEELEPDELHEPYELKARRDPLKVRSSHNPLVASTWYKNGISPEDGRPCPLWVVVDMKRTRELLAEKKKEKRPVETAAPMPEDAGAKETATDPVEATTEKPVITPAKPAEQLLTGDALRKRLEELKGLFDDGLIDEEEYKAMKKKAIDGVK